MSRRQRPTAFDVSFPDEISEASTGLQEDDNRSARSSSAPKRKKRDDMTESLQYTPDHDDIYEGGKFVIPGEDPDAVDEDGIPVRVLSEFCIFDPKDGYHLYSLDDENFNKHQLQAAGVVSPVYVNEEDEGQEDGVDGSVQRFRTTDIEQYSLNYESRDEVTQILISSAKENPMLQWDELIESTTTRMDPLLGAEIKPDDFLATVPLISVILSEIQVGERLKNVPAVRRLLEGDVPVSRLSTPAPVAHPGRHHRPGMFVKWNKKIDLAVLRRENQNPTHVTPLIDQLARGWFNERLHVVGVKLPEERRESEAKRARLWMLQRLGDYIERQMKKKTSKKARLDSYAAEDRIIDEYWKSIVIDGVKYSIGDTVLTPRGNYEQRNERAPDMPKDLADIPEDAIISDFFWFGRIMHINQQRRKIHLQWFDHAPRSILEELADPRELFLWNSCGEINADDAYDKVDVRYREHYSKPNDTRLDRTDPSVFYCNYICDETTACFTHISDEHRLSPQTLTPPDNCPPCQLLSQQEQDRTVVSLRDGVAYGGHRYHKNDFVVCYNEDAGPANVVQIVDFVRAKGRERSVEAATVHVLGRIGDIIGIPDCPAQMMKDHQHLFMTEQEAQVPIEAFLEPCFVVTRRSLNDDDASQGWLSSPRHFYVKYEFPTLAPTSWTDQKTLKCNDLLVCAECFEEEKARTEAFQRFIQVQRRRPLRGFDPFGGVGAFGLAMEESGCVKMQQAVEISPSAACALRNNSPQMVVYNQCANVVLEYAIKSFEGHRPPVPREVGRSHERLPDPPKPEDIDVVVAGFPCQPHSRLNMYQHANDRKSHLVLNLLSWVDFLQPRYCVFENVRGFLQYSLHTYQAGSTVPGYTHPPSLPQPTHDFPLVDALQMKFSNESKAQPIRTQRGFAPHRFVSVDDAIGDLPRFHWTHLNEGNQAGDVPELPCDRSKWFCGFAGPDVEYESAPRTTFQAKCRSDHIRDIQHFTEVPVAKKVERVVSIPMSAKADYRSLDGRLLEWQTSNPSSAVARLGMYGRLNKDEWFNTTVTNVQPDAKQSWVLHPYCKRMVTVRELARSQGFPDSFVFHSEDEDVKALHRQIGNAVPWPVAAAISRELSEAAFKKWHHDMHMATDVEDN
ncbi:uncharacterized protein B0H18DRAFT_1082741 [Fomitopsis serialis]|uniref:uncharacterized protein n=1 Tax=Fomitopsis serialis TaxID=139415 RepID=UPI002008A529|nr:uncharacterized protein B0H18DRAFT_1082741 [Neoantrodia serialis]KAH9935023.1 hypothetical protein B0H18DRAFT_1082741 [Neoantrodia serialis]